MSFVKLTKHTYENDEELREFLDNAPKHARTILLLPKTATWNKFKAHVKKYAGGKRASRMVNYLVYKWLQEEDITPLNTEDEVLSHSDARSNVNLSVDYDIWTEFTDRLEQNYGKRKIQTEVLDMILEEYLST